MLKSLCGNVMTYAIVLDSRRIVARSEPRTIARPFRSVELGIYVDWYQQREACHGVEEIRPLQFSVEKLR